MRHFLALLLILPLAACKEDQAAIPDPIPLTVEAVSYFCQMNVLEHGGPKAQVHLEGLPAPLFFAQVRDAVAYLKSEERDRRVAMTYVSDMGQATSWNEPGENNWTSAADAFFVIGAGVRGGMGAPEIVPFATRESAEAFVVQYGGTITTLNDIPNDTVLGPVDLAQVLEEPA
ncbi:MAG: copper resistance protein CopZ [Silicimonas sp.]|nr:copper resistance protein CopZ [Silicimonas sp.]